LFFHYPEDKAFEDIEHTFMVGSALKVSPVLAAGDAPYPVYFPIGNWVDLNNFSNIIRVSENGTEILLTPSMNYTQVHLREG